MVMLATVGYCQYMVGLWELSFHCWVTLEPLGVLRSNRVPCTVWCSASNLLLAGLEIHTSGVSAELRECTECTIVHSIMRRVRRPGSVTSGLSQTVRWMLLSASAGEMTMKVGILAVRFDFRNWWCSTILRQAVPKRDQERRLKLENNE